MSQANAAIVQQRQSRADLALADLAANGGLLLPEQANQFIDFILEAPTSIRTSPAMLTVRQTTGA